MTRRPITPRMHGILDYTTGATFQLVPKLLGLSGTRSGWLFRAFGALHAGYSLLTRYELGVWKVLPYKAHLGLDGVWAVGLISAPWLFGTKDQGPRHWVPFAFFGVYELGTLALSDPWDDEDAMRPGQPLFQTGEERSPASAERSARSGAERSTPSRSTPSRGPALPRWSRDDVVLPDGAEATLGIGARTVGGGDFGADPHGRTGGVGSGAGPGSDPPVGGQTQ